MELYTSNLFDTYFLDKREHKTMTVNNEIQENYSEQQSAPAPYRNGTLKLRVWGGHPLYNISFLVTVTSYN